MDAAGPGEGYQAGKLGLIDRSWSQGHNLLQEL